MDQLSLGLWLLVQSATGAAKVREIAGARVPLAERIAADAALQAALSAKNASTETADQIQRKDREWTARPEQRRATTEGPCADRLRELVKEDTFVIEAFLMDARGALVCATRETTDYYQGDEAKWRRTYQDGRRVFVDEPALDASVGMYAIQLSVLVSTDSARAGAVTLTLKVPDAVAR